MRMAGFAHWQFVLWPEESALGGPFSCGRETPPGREERQGFALCADCRPVRLCTVHRAVRNYFSRWCAKRQARTVMGPPAWGSWCAQPPARTNNEPPSGVERAAFRSPTAIRFPPSAWEQPAGSADRIEQKDAEEAEGRRGSREGSTRCRRCEILFPLRFLPWNVRRHPSHLKPHLSPARTPSTGRVRSTRARARELWFGTSIQYPNARGDTRKSGERKVESRTAWWAASRLRLFALAA